MDTQLHRDRLDDPARDVRIDPEALSETLKAQHRVRMPSLDADSLQDFARGMKLWVMNEGATAPVLARQNAFLAARGHSAGPTNMGYEESFNLLLEQPSYAARTRVNWSIHDFMWDRALRAFWKDSDAFFEAMEATDNAGPGSLELNPDMEIPAYACHEIHRQPGGFVGEAFAGWVYHYCLSRAHYLGRNDHDEVFFQLAQSHVAPADGQVNRILDVGCGVGQLTTALKQRFPKAEVWGVDLAGPMVRYAHHRAAKMDIDVHFAQRLAEDSKFPDNHFDIVTDYIVFHEANRQAMQDIVKEAFRVLRPGGVFGHLDAPTSDHPTKAPPNDIAGKAMLWNIYRNNYEPFYLDYSELNLLTVMREAGFEVDATGPAILWNGRPRVVGVKPLTA